MLTPGWWSIETMETDGPTLRAVEILETEGPLARIRERGWNGGPGQVWVLNTYCPQFIRATPIDEPRAVEIVADYDAPERSVA